jgi:hypothetical protein
VLRATAPAILVCEEKKVFRPTSRTLHAIGPATRYYVFTTVVWVGEVYYGFLKAGRLAHVFYYERSSRFSQLYNCPAESYPYVVAQRNQFIADGILAERDGLLVFTRNAEFSSPSAAAAVIHGGSANGLIVWKTREGKTLKEPDAQA